IKANKLIKQGEIIGVATSGGRDSMALLHFLHQNREMFECQVIAINIDHCIREHSAADSAFVMDYCKENNIKAYTFKVDAVKLSRDEKLSVEAGARKARYNTFEALIERGLVDKIALAHHMYDQAETILLNLLRGCGLTGAKGMEPMRDNKYIRPMLTVPREEIMSYIDEYAIPFVEDETNADNNYSRNYLRNVSIPTIRKRFKSVDKNLVHFADICAEDDKYINSQIEMGSIAKLGDVTRVPMYYFSYQPAVINRVLFKVLSNYASQDIESRHIALICDFARDGQNGDSIDLPFGIKVHKEYEYLTIAPLKTKTDSVKQNFAKGKTYIEGFGTIRIVSSKVFNDVKPHQHVVDASKVPANAIWRFKDDKDLFIPFGHTSTKKLKDFLADKKIPQRLRNNIPVLAVDNTVYIVADLEISDNLKVDESSTNLYKINYEKDII
ncbi:MAG: tRNA lysidine(34) synthetase TilS, partial [Clostridia bacterium]|nr:tRNA lysidine(34) synthetase TilS [Clostridia bacterium]